MKKAYSAPELEVELFDAVVMDVTTPGSNVNFSKGDDIGTRGLFSLKDPDDLLKF